MKFDAIANKDRIKAERAAAFHGRRYFYTTPNDGHVIIGVLRGLGDAWIVGYFMESGARKAIRSNRLWSTTHVDDLQQRLDVWATERGLKEAL